MPKIIQTMLDVMPEESVLIRSAYLRNDIRASSLVKEAQRRASDMLARSEEQAEQRYLAAKTDGYTAGILDAAGEMVNFLAAHADLATQLEQRLRQKVESILRFCVSDIGVVMAAFEESMGQSEKAALVSLDVLLPDNLRHHHRSIVERLQEHIGVQVNVEYHQEARFVFRYGDGVAEFSPDEFVARAGARAMDDLPSIYAANRTLAEKCRENLATLFAPDASALTKTPSVQSLVKGGA